MTIGRRDYGPNCACGIVAMRRSAGLLRTDATFGVSLYQLGPDYASGRGGAAGRQPAERFAKDKTLFADLGACKLVARYSFPGEVESYFGHCFVGGEYSITQQGEHLLLKLRGERENRYGHKYVLITSGTETQGFQIYELGGVEDPILEAMYGVTGPGDPGAMFGLSENFVYSLAPDRPGPARVRRKRELERRIFGIGRVDAAELVEAYLAVMPELERHQGRFGGSEGARKYMDRARADLAGGDYALALALQVESIPGLRRVKGEAEDFGKLRPLPHGPPCFPSRFVFDDYSRSEWRELVSEESGGRDEHGATDSRIIEAVI